MPVCVSAHGVLSLPEARRVTPRLAQLRGGSFGGGGAPMPQKYSNLGLSGPLNEQQ